MSQRLLPIAQVGARRTGPHKGGRQQKYVLTDQGRDLILREYDGTTERIDALSARIGVPRHRIKKWAMELGLTRTKEPRWTEEEERYLEVQLHQQSLTAIAAHLGRTKTAVQLKARRLGTNKTQEGYTMRGLCLGLGCDHHKVEKWLRHGWLKGTRRQTERHNGQRGDFWCFTDKDIRAFVRTHPLEIDPRRMDWPWVVDILAGIRGEKQ